MNTRTFGKAIVPALALLLASCAETPAETTDRPFPRDGIILEPDFPDVEPPVPPDDARPFDAMSAASALRTGFTSALTNHTELLAVTVDAMTNGGDAQLARETLHDNSFVLADYVEMVHDDDARSRFYDAWTAYTEAMLGFAAAQGPNAQPGDLQDALRDLAAARRDVVGLMVDLNPLIRRGPFQRGLRRWEDAQLRMIEAVATDDPTQWARTRMAARRSFLLAAEWSRPFDDFLERDGDPDDPAARIRAQSVFLLEEHVYLLWFASRHNDAGGALRGNVDAYARLVGEAYGPLAQQEFHMLWDARSMALLDYAAAERFTDEKALQQAQVELDLANNELTELLFNLDPTLDPEVIRPALREFDGAVIEALNGLADPAMNEIWWDPPEDAYDDVRQASMFAEHLATAFAKAMADPAP